MQIETSAQADVDRKSPIGTASKQPRGFLYHYGPQAWIDMIMSRVMIVGRAWPLVSYTFVPILRMVADPEKVDRDYAEIRSRREQVRLFDSPRERWRKYYGNFVRETEWALLELRKHFTQAQYEEIVVGTSVALSREGPQGFMNMMNKMANRKPPKKAPNPDAPTKVRGMQKMMFEMFNPAGFLTGPAEITEYNPAAGSVVMEIPDCAWLVCAAAESLPNPEALPEEGCLLICKGSFEKLFNGNAGGLSIEFDPHLPETSCTVRMCWKAQ